MSLEITKDNFEAEVMQSDRTVLIDFWAPWCMPCRMLAPTLEEIAAERPDIKVCKVNTDEQMELAKIRHYQHPLSFRYQRRQSCGKTGRTASKGRDSALSVKCRHRWRDFYAVFDFLFRRHHYLYLPLSPANAADLHQLLRRRRRT